VSIPSTTKGTLGKELLSKSLTCIPERILLMMVDDLGFVLRSKLVWWKRNAIPHSSKDKFTPDFEPVYVFSPSETYHPDYEPVYFFTKRPHYWHELQLEPCQEASMEQNGWGAVGGKKYAMYPEYSGKPANQRPMRTMRCVWDVPVVPNDTEHIAPFPPRLVEPMVRAGCPRRVCTKCGKPEMPRYRGNTVVGWSTCRCHAPFRRGIVADIFAGSGTALMVAKALGRDWVGVEIKQEYVEDAYRRLQPSRDELAQWLSKQDKGVIRQTTLEGVV